MMKLVPGRRLDRKIGRFDALEDCVDEIGGAVPVFAHVDAVADEPAGLRKLAQAVHGGQSGRNRQLRYSSALGDEHQVRKHKHELAALACQGLERGRDFVRQRTSTAKSVTPSAGAVASASRRWATIPGLPMLTSIPVLLASTSAASQSFFSCLPLVAATHWRRFPSSAHELFTTS
jgi:hypothetical protein